MIMATVIVTLRHSPVATSDRTYLRRIAWGSFPGDQRRDFGGMSLRPLGGKAPRHGSRTASPHRGGPASAVHASRLVADDLSALNFDDSAAHLVHDVVVVGDH